MQPLEEEPDEVLASLDALVRVLQENGLRNERAIARASVIRQERLSGKSYREIIASEQRPLVLEMATQSLDRLMAAGARLRRAEANALHREGMTMDRIASLFGVTRQRVSALLRSRSTAA